MNNVVTDLKKYLTNRIKNIRNSNRFLSEIESSSNITEELTCKDILDKINRLEDMYMGK